MKSQALNQQTSSIKLDHLDDPNHKLLWAPSLMYNHLLQGIYYNVSIYFYSSFTYLYKFVPTDSKNKGRIVAWMCVKSWDPNHQTVA